MSTVFLPGLGEWRRKAGLKQLKLAEMADLTPETVCRYEKRYRPVSIMSAQRLAELLGVAVDVLTGGAPVPGSGPTRPNLTTTVYLPGLRAWRKQAGLTQVQLADLAGSRLIRCAAMKNGTIRRACGLHSGLLNYSASPSRS